MNILTTLNEVTDLPHALTWLILSMTVTCLYLSVHVSIDPSVTYPWLARYGRRLEICVWLVASMWYLYLALIGEGLVVRWPTFTALYFLALSRIFYYLSRLVSPTNSRIQ